MRALIFAQGVWNLCLASLKLSNPIRIALPHSTTLPRGLTSIGAKVSQNLKLPLMNPGVMHLPKGF